MRSKENLARLEIRMDQLEARLARAEKEIAEMKGGAEAEKDEAEKAEAGKAKAGTRKRSAAKE